VPRRGGGLLLLCILHAIRLPGLVGPPSLPLIHLRYSRAIWARTVPGKQWVPNDDDVECHNIRPSTYRLPFPSARRQQGERRPNQGSHIA
jgi:hypothetical protein